MDIYEQRKKNSKTIAEKYDATVNNYILITILWKNFANWLVIIYFVDRNIN